MKHIHGGPPDATHPNSATLTPLTRESPLAAWEYWIRVARRMAFARNKRTAEDVAQDAVLVLWDRAGAEPIEYPAAFLICCILRLEKREIRRRAVSERNEDGLALSRTSVSTPEENVATAEPCSSPTNTRI